MIIGDRDDGEGNYLYVAHLMGEPYEMGLAFGQMFKSELTEQLDLFYDYYLGQLK
jgi:hypothetical protein